MATPKYDKEAHAASLIKTLSGMGYTVTKGEPASKKEKTTTPLVSQRVGKANVPPMAKSSGAPIRTPADRVAAGSAPGPTPARYNPFPNTPGMGGRVRVGPPGSIGGGGQGYSPVPQGPPGSIGAQRPMGPPSFQQGMGGSELMSNPALSPMQGGAMPDMSVPPAEMMNRITGEQPNQQPSWNPYSLWSMLQGR